MKQRLVGAIVLVALAVIFLPMLLDGSGRSGPRDIAIEIPEEPQPPANRLEDSRDFADTVGTDRDEGAAGAATSESAPDGAAGGDPQERDAVAVEEAAPRPEEDAAASGTDAAAEEAEASSGAGDATAASGQRAAADGAQPAAGDAGWIVQVGSFSRETNALVLRDRLRESGFESFVERTESGGRTLWRVRIGPIATREEADRLSERVAEQRGEPALVMSHP